MHDAGRAAVLLAVDPLGLGGAVVRGGAGPQRDEWLAMLRSGLAAEAPWRKLPLHASDEQLLGGLDLAATLHSSRPVARAGLLAQTAGGVLVIAMAERLPRQTAARLTAALDQAQLAVVALDEGRDDDERPPAALLDRLAFALDLSAMRAADVELVPLRVSEVAAARQRCAQVDVSAELLDALCAAATALGVDSARALLFALRATRAAAALSGRAVAVADDASLAVRLVLAPRATQLPAQEPPAEPEAQTSAAAAEPESEPKPPPSAEATNAEETLTPDTPDVAHDKLEDMLIEAARAAIPAGLLAAMAVATSARSRSTSEGRAGATQASRSRGRPLGARRGDPRAGARLALIDTLRAAAPWQRLRRAEAGLVADAATTSFTRIHVRREDLHVQRYQQRSATTMVFVIDASGSSALHRLAEAKGAVELLLADCYVRRDSVAVIGFRGQHAQLLLPATRSLVRAKRCLAGLPGGGGTPLAAGIGAAAMLAEQVARSGATPLLVFLTDGRANIARDGSPGRGRATEDARLAARAVRAAGWASVLIDTSARPDGAALELAAALGARCVALPHARSNELAREVTLATRVTTVARQRRA